MALFDLISLCQQQPDALESCLAPLLCSSSVLKLGFEVSGDISKLAGSWPAVSCFRQVVGVLDLRPVWVAYGLATKQQVCPFLGAVDSITGLVLGSRAWCGAVFFCGPLCALHAGMLASHWQV